MPADSEVQKTNSISRIYAALEPKASDFFRSLGSPCS